MSTQARKEHTDLHVSTPARARTIELPPYGFTGQPRVHNGAAGEALRHSPSISSSISKSARCVDEICRMDLGGFWSTLNVPPVLELDNAGSLCVVLGKASRSEITPYPADGWPLGPRYTLLGAQRSVTGRGNAHQHRVQAAAPEDDVYAAKLTASLSPNCFLLSPSDTW
jgi:hypothetical protein